LDRASLEEVRQTASREEVEGVAAEVLDAHAPGGLVPVVPDNFFCEHPVCWGFPAVVPSAILARHGPRVL
jgi:hypothetical protein